MSELSKAFGDEGSPQQAENGRVSYYGFNFKAEVLDEIARHPLFRPSQGEMKDDAEFALEGSRENAAAAILKATRHVHGASVRQGQVTQATGEVLKYLRSLPEEDFKVDGDEPGFFDPDEVAEELRGVLEQKLGKKNVEEPSPPQV